MPDRSSRAKSSATGPGESPDSVPDLAERAWRGALTEAGLDVDFGTRRRAEYSADASNYRHVPRGVAFPRSAADVEAAVRICGAHGVPVTLRGGGTSVAGNAIGEGLVLDCSRSFGRVLELDAAARTARVEPGVVLDALQAAAAPHGLRFGPDPSTASRCTIGGMIGNNACGARSLAFGTTADNVLALDVLLADGTRTTVRRGTSGVAALDSRLRDLVARHDAAIRAELGRFPRQVSGYALQHLLPENGFDVAKALVGSEGTLAAVLGAELRLVPVLREPVLVVAAYPDMVAAAADVPAVLPHQPSAIEGLGAELAEVWSARRKRPLPAALPEGGGWLFIETTAEQAASVVADLAGAHATRVVLGPAEQRELWRIREDGAGLATRTPGGAEAWPGFEDAAVPPERLADYLRGFEALMRSAGRRGTVFGHFGEGCLHVRIDHDLQTGSGRQQFAEFTAAATELVVAHGGSVSGEHGDGQARSELLAAMYSPELLAAFAEFKAAFDPAAVLNPAILVAPRAFAADLRAPRVMQAAPPQLALAGDEGDFGRAVRRCVGVGKCRSASGGVMCPSFRATGDEKDSTRGRARVLQEMLDGRAVGGGYAAPEVLDALDLCLGCKGCKTDCPVGVDMAAYKTEVLYQHYRGRVRPAAHYSLGWLPVWARLAGFAPRVVNRLMASPLAPLLKRAGGIAGERALPRFAVRSFRRARADAVRAEALQSGRRVGPLPHAGAASAGSAADPVVRSAAAQETGAPAGAWSGSALHTLSGTRSVVLWADTFTENFTPAVGEALIAVLRSAGFRVVVPPRTGCCGLTWISTGQLGVARRVLSRTLELMRPAIEAGLPIVVPEPSCAAALREELTEVLPSHPLAARAAGLVTGPAQFLAAHAPDWRPPASPWSGHKALIQIHCHQYASGATGEAEVELLARAGVAATVVSGCCGLAGDFGVTAGHYDVSMAVAELNLLPAIRAASSDTLLVADGFSCRTQVEQAVAERRVWHVAEVLAAGLPTPEA
ncbi:FAD-binding oxidoreductase [Catenulispora sp. NF23]|uniref:FAD-binding oxidoreductase n=1 Tax=Catenulispora pinistramenti TaxID=2705254 RepID=A0ABS5KNU3_9ACTN|nr:FAD-binding and (Fe-S)-binding domain-containing protein [Catenulispora pinistramenti]MBS2531780.1 FAD-binding oxidoreductase [Catenulispora pinistramenti]MBS2547674.1 FAD-binding oxidoreductase [Catenulispora pinistramenti]